MMPGTTLVAIRMAEQIVARAVARMFMMLVLFCVRDDERNYTPELYARIIRWCPERR